MVSISGATHPTPMAVTDVANLTISPLAACTTCLNMSKIDLWVQIGHLPHLHTKPLVLPIVIIQNPIATNPAPTHQTITGPIHPSCTILTLPKLIQVLILIPIPTHTHQNTMIPIHMKRTGTQMNILDLHPYLFDRLFRSRSLWGDVRSSQSRDNSRDLGTVRIALVHVLVPSPL